MHKLSSFSELHALAKKIKGYTRQWWVCLETGRPLDRPLPELLALTVSELSEALEGERKNLMDDKLPHRKMAEVEMADAVIRLLDFGINMRVFNLTALERRLRFVNSFCLASDAFPAESKGKGSELYSLMRTVCEIAKADDESRTVYIDINRYFVSLGLIQGYCLKYGYDLWGAIDEKLEFNRTREDHKVEARRAANGKKF